MVFSSFVGVVMQVQAQIGLNMQTHAFEKHFSVSNPIWHYVNMVND